MKDRDLQKHTLNLFAGDFDKLQRLYPDVGAAAVVRRLVQKHVQDKLKPIDPPKVEVKL